MAGRAWSWRCCRASSCRHIEAKASPLLASSALRRGATRPQDFFKDATTPGRGEQADALATDFLQPGMRQQGLGIGAALGHLHLQDAAPVERRRGASADREPRLAMVLAQWTDGIGKSNGGGTGGDHAGAGQGVRQRVACRRCHQPQRG
jgi:hypothetical protein